MSPLEIILIAITLSLDAAIVSVGAGATNKVSLPKALFIAGIFGIFQSLMPLLGWFGGYAFGNSFMRYGHIIGFVLILIVALKMFMESFDEEDSKNTKDLMHIPTLFALAVATSIDALVVGVTFNFVPVFVPLAIGMFGMITFLVCLCAVYIGFQSRRFISTKLGIIGALILMSLAFKILVFS